ncbi:hypothetical protein JKY72_00180, partial [Candidatus Gracilibacteria bacterium]|nr:hypothetical protein [Candidatus Gracilibacteria bacterium]
MEKKNFLQRESLFILLMGIFLIAALIFRDNPAIAMWIGFGLAGYSAIANDSIQTLGTFIASNSKRPWWLLWIFVGGIMLAVLLWGWHTNGGDPAFGRLEKIDQPLTFNMWQLGAPIILIILTRFNMP